MHAHTIQCTVCVDECTLKTGISAHATSKTTHMHVTNLRQFRRHNSFVRATKNPEDRNYNFDRSHKHISARGERKHHQVAFKDN